MVLIFLDFLMYPTCAITLPYFILGSLKFKTTHAIAQPAIAGHKSHVADHGRRLRPAFAGAKFIIELACLFMTAADNNMSPGSALAALPDGRQLREHIRLVFVLRCAMQVPPPTINL